MAENFNNAPDSLKRKYTEVYAEICEIIDGTKSFDKLKDTGALSPRLRELIALSSAIGTECGRETVVSCVANCLKAGASREQILEVLHLAVLIAEVPAETYGTIVHEAIDSFESQD